MVMSLEDNTVPGPPGDPNGDRYANVFTSLSKIPSNTIGIPMIASGKMYISFKKPLYLWVNEDANGTLGYAAPDLLNPTDPNQGIRFETIEFTWASNGLWINPTRVDAYQYPMGVEVFGPNSFYHKVGELKSHKDIIALWQELISAPFQPCYKSNFNDEGDGILLQPSKIQEFKPGGVSEFYYKNYVDKVWSTFSNGNNLSVDVGNEGIWEGGVVPGSEDVFTMSCVKGCSTHSKSGSVLGKPTTQELIEAKGKLAAGGEYDKNVQKWLAAAFHRAVIDTTVTLPTLQLWGDRDTYYQTSDSEVDNEYASFFHGYDISVDLRCYAFAYDDVFEQSATINYPGDAGEAHIRITLGGFFNM
jgi:hypothetical protein